MAWEYSDKTKELFMNAVQGKPGTHLGEIDNADGYGEHGSLACGDAMRFTFRVSRHGSDPTQDKITEARYLTFGCTSAIASSEALCDIIENGGYTPIEALKITNEDIVKYLGGLPAQKIHCSVMGAEALEAAVFNWAQKRGVDMETLGLEAPAREEQEGRIVCKCFSASEPYLKRRIQELELRTVAEITNTLKAGGACTTCHLTPGGLQDLLDEIWGRPSTTFVESPRSPQSSNVIDAVRSELSPYRFAKKVESVVERSIQPLLRREGGDVEIVDIKEGLVYVRLTGSCEGCENSSLTLKMMVEQTLKNEVDERVRVIEV